MPAFTKTKAKKKKPVVLTLEERLEALQADIDAAVAQIVDEKAAACPGVPRGIVEQILVGRAHGCRCEQLKLINKGKT
jgi:hypothetical protein